jgi:hypothetical protein
MVTSGILSPIYLEVVPLGTNRFGAKDPRMYKAVEVALHNPTIAPVVMLREGGFEIPLNLPSTYINIDGTSSLKKFLKNINSAITGKKKLYYLIVIIIH